MSVIPSKKKKSAIIGRLYIFNAYVLGRDLLLVNHPENRPDIIRDGPIRVIRVLFNHQKQILRNGNLNHELFW